MSSMRHGSVCFPVYRECEGRRLLLCNSFSVSRDNFLVTCAHALDHEMSISVFDRETGGFVNAVFKKFSLDIDLAVILPTEEIKTKALTPFLPGRFILYGSDIRVFGRVTGPEQDVKSIENDMHFSGYVSRIFGPKKMKIGSVLDRYQEFSASCPAIEGLSGSMVFTNHNGVKVAGMVVGNEYVKS